MKYAINFLVRDGWKAADISKKISDVYGDQALSRSQVFKLVSRASEGYSAAVRLPGSGRPISATTEENVEKIDAMIREDRRISIRDIAEEISISLERVNHTIRDTLGFKKCAAAWIPKDLTEAQRQARIDICNTHLELIEEQGNDYLRNVVTCDESWVYYEDPPTRKEARHYRHSSSPLLSVAKRGLTPKKRLLITFFGVEGLICTTFLPEGSTMDSKTYIGIIRTRVIRKIREKRPELSIRGGQHFWVLHQDNARPHTSAYTRQWLAANGIPVMEHPPYSPDLAPCDFWLFPNLKKDLRGIVFETEDHLKQATLASLNTITIETHLKSVIRAGFHELDAVWKRKDTNFKYNMRTEIYSFYMMIYRA
jgi:histone-lysine N-methyltransferase SETMAR